MILPDEVMQEISTFKEDRDVFHINMEFNDLNLGKAKKNYEKILKKLETLVVYDPIKLKYQKISLDELKKYTLSLLTKIYGEEYKERIEQLNSMLKIHSNLDNPFEAALEEDKVDGVYVTRFIHISKFLAPIQILSTSHEFVHDFLGAYTSERYNSVLSNLHYRELLSILTEYIICYEISKDFEDNIKEQHENIRLFHNHQHAIELKESQKLNAQGINYCDLKDYFEYVSHNSYCYIVSDIFASKLAEYYITDQKTLLKFIRNIVKGLNSINELLEHYQIGLNKPDVVFPYFDKMDRVERLSLSKKS